MPCLMTPKAVTPHPKPYVGAFKDGWSVWDGETRRLPIHRTRLEAEKAATLPPPEEGADQSLYTDAAGFKVGHGSGAQDIDGTLWNGHVGSIWGVPDGGYAFMVSRPIFQYASDNDDFEAELAFEEGHPSCSAGAKMDAENRLPVPRARTKCFIYGGTHYCENMPFTRTGSTEALDALAWHFNFFPGKTMSVNEVAEATGMAWATVRKFASSLEDLRVLAPELEIKPDGILVRKASPRVARVTSEPMSTAALYLHIHARLLGNPSHPILLSQHKAFAENFSNPLKELVSLGLAEMESGSVKLTAQGISFASNLLESILAPELLEEVEEPEAPPAARLNPRP
jgi:hypothetical protein